MSVLYHKGSIHNWQIIKYKPIRRCGREEHTDVRVILEESSKKLTVVCGSEELDSIYCNMEVSKYPALKMKDTQLYVAVNNQSQGFRLTFRYEDKAQFLSIIRKIAYISETPVKNHMNRSFTNTDRWCTNVGKTQITSSSSHPISFSQPPSLTETSLKKAAAKNLFKVSTPEFYQNSDSPSSPSPFYSQPVDSSYPRPESNASSVSSSIYSAYSSLNEDSPFSGFSQWSSCSSFQSSCSAIPATPSSVNSVGSSHSSSLKLLLDPYSSKNPVVHTKNQYVQTEGCSFDELLKNPAFMEEYLERVKKSDELIRLVKLLRSQIQKIPLSNFTEFKKAIQSLRQGGHIVPPSIPLVNHQSSELENTDN